MKMVCILTSFNEDTLILTVCSHSKLILWNYFPEYDKICAWDNYCFLKWYIHSNASSIVTKKASFCYGVLFFFNSNNSSSVSNICYPCNYSRYFMSQRQRKRSTSHAHEGKFLVYEVFNWYLMESPQVSSSSSTIFQGLRLTESDKAEIARSIDDYTGFGIRWFLTRLLKPRSIGIAIRMERKV